MAVRFLTTLLTISMVLGTGRALSCYECGGYSTAKHGMVISGEEEGLDNDGNCEQKTCGSEMDTCITATYKVSAIRKEERSSEWIPMENNMIYQKGCGQKVTATCEVLKTHTVAAGEEDEDVKDVEFSACDVETCDTDNCNTKTPKEINSAYSEPISCYTCSPVAGSIEDFDIPVQECTEDNKKECPFGVTQCSYGNFNVTSEVEGVSITQKVDYIKTCAASCDTLKMFGVDATVNCNIGYCSGDLCNTQTVEEVKAYKSGSSAVQSAIILLTASILFFIG